MSSPRLRIGDLVAFAPVAPVLALADTTRLRDDLHAQAKRPSPGLRSTLEALLGGYLIERPENRAACDALLASLAAGTGRAFFLRGVYGAGKTHLLSVLTLLADQPAAWPFFLASHPEYRRLAQSLARRRRLVVPVSLDEFRGSGRGLEDIVFGQIERELARPRYGVRVTLSDAAEAIRLLEQFAFPRHRAAFEAYLRRAESAAWEDLRDSDPARAGALARRFAERIGLRVAPTRSRADALAGALEGGKRAHLDGLVLLLDELGLFLSSKTRRELNEDASFLQFVAERARRAPVWLVAAIQRQVEDIGDVDAYSLRQIKDRFTTCTLDIAQLRTVLSRRVVVRKDPEAFARATAEMWRARGGDRLGFSGEDLALSYPINPLALDLLEALADSVLSKTRSLLQFVQWAAADGLLGLPADRLLTADVIFRHFRDQMEGLPELRRHLAAHRFFIEHLRRIGTANPPLASALVATLTLLAVAGVRWPARDLADALIGSEAWAQAAPESPQAFRDLVVRELDALRRRGAYLEIVRSVEPGGDQYFLDVSTDVSEVIRRRINQVVDAFEARDGRVLAAAVAACGQAAFPLSSFAEPRAVSFEWTASRRSAMVSRRDLTTLRPEDIPNLAALLAAPHCREDVHLILGEIGHVEQQAEAWRRAAAVLTGRDADTLVAWIPREPTGAEWRELSEHASLRMLADDPTIAGRQAADLRRRVRERLIASGAEAAAVVARLYYEGQALDARGQPTVEGAGLAAQGDWQATLAAVLSQPLARRFPRFASVAPRRLIARVHVSQIIDHFVRPGQVSLPPGSGLEAHLNDFLALLGFVAQRDGAFVLRVAAAPLVAFIESQVPERAAQPLDSSQLRAYGDLVSALAKSEFGLAPEQSELAIACLVRAGHLVALDAFCQPLSFDRIGTPIGDHIAFLTRAQLLDADAAAALGEAAQAILGRRPVRFDLAAQQRLWEGVLAWKRRTLEEAPRLQTALERLVAALGHEPVQWSETRRALDTAAEVARALDEGLTARDGLLALAAATQGEAHVLKAFAQARAFLLEDAEAIGAAYAYGTDPRFQVLAESLLVSQRQGFLRWVARAEAMISQRARTRRAADDMLRTYATEYLAWHQQVHAARRFAGYPALRQGDAHRALQTVSATGVDGGEALRQIEAAIHEQMAKHCPGAELKQALASRPVCEACGMRLGDGIELTPPARIEQRIRASVQRLLRLLHEPDIAPAIEQRLAAEQNSETAAAVRAAMRLPPTAEPPAVVKVFTREAAAWIADCLRRRPVARRRLDDLIALLANRQLTKRELAQAFARWLDAAGEIGDDDTVEVR